MWGGERGRSGGEAGAQSVRSQEESAAAGQWTVSATDPNGHRAVSDTLEYKVWWTLATRGADGLRVGRVEICLKICLSSVKEERLQEGSDAA